MTIKQGAAWPLALLISIGVSSHLDAQKKTTPSRPGTVEFRCSGPNLCSSSATNRIVGDVSGYPGEAGGAVLGGNNELYLVFGSGVSQLVMDLTDGLDLAPPCGTSCRLPSIVLSPDAPIVTVFQTAGNIRTQAFDEATGQPLINGLLGLQLHVPARAKLKISFYDPLGRDILWGLNFTPEDYVGATMLNVTRTSACTWEYEPATADSAGLSTFGTTGTGKRVRTNEGLYSMPFQFTFTVPQLCP